MYLFFAFLMGIFYIIAGINHFWNPKFYKKMMPSFFPFPEEIIIFSGMIEIILGMGVFFDYTRRFSASGIIIVLLLVFPANIKMAMYPDEWKKKFSPWALYARLPMQIGLIYWAYLYT
jgi:uncharacterized membrane protein